MNMKSSTDIVISYMWGATYVTLFTWLKILSKAITLPANVRPFCWFHETSYFFLVKDKNHITRDSRLQPRSRRDLHSSEILRST